MGIVSNLETRQRLCVPDTPPWLASPSDSSPFSRPSRPTNRTCIRPNTASLQVLNYDDTTMSSNQASSRQQLPSLYSLFGPPSATRPPYSPSKREIWHLAKSPCDRPRISPGIRNSSTSYFAPIAASPVTQPRSTYDYRLNIHSMVHSYCSQRPRKYFKQQCDRSVSRAESESSKWSVHRQASRHKHSSGSTDPVVQSLEDRVQTQLPEPEKLPRDYSSQRTTKASSSASPRPEGSAASEGMPLKKGPGPKIWTGTHFLPRFVRAAEVPGEGILYFYDDGSYCNAVIDGEAVNAYWGLTKAGKPRKRLAMACIACRKKKIKCDPEYPRCVQCEKLGRICKYKMRE